MNRDELQERAGDLARTTGPSDAGDPLRSMQSGTLIIRADASVAMGTGHVMRCLALAQAWQDQARQEQGGKCIFAMAETTAGSEERVRAEKCEVARLAASPGSSQDAQQLAELALSRQADWVVVDGYQFDVEYQRKVKTAGVKLLVVDDTCHAGAHVADLVLDQNAHASQDLYQHREPHTMLLLGSRYAMLRREFKPWREWKREIASHGRKVLVTVGGTDPDNVTLRVIEGLQLLAPEKLEATIVAGGGNPHGDCLEQAVRRAGGGIRLLKGAMDMPQLMADADVAISAAGTTCWEMCFLGLPAMLFDVAENQTPVARELDRQGIAIHAGSSHDVTPERIATQLKELLAAKERREEMSQRARNLVDGRGAERALAAMRNANLGLRRVEAADCRLLWEWANEPEVRSASFSSLPIPWEEHLEWFTRKLGDAGILMLIASDERGVPVGQVRFERTKDREADIDVSVVRERRGGGLGAGLIEKAVQTAFQETDLVRVHAFVKTGNRASAKAFERADFRNAGSTRVRGSAAVHYERDRNGR